MKKTNWRATLNKDFLAAPDLDDGEGGYIETVATIREVKLQKVKDPMGEEKVCKVAHFQEKLKPLILNVGHCELIEKFTGSRYIEDWQGQQIQLWVKLNEKAFGELIDAVRIRPEPPRQRQELTPQHEKWPGAVQSYAEKGDEALPVIEKYFDLSPENLDKLKLAADETRAA